MKNLMILIIFVFAAAFFAGCSSDTTEIGWDNGVTTTFTTITWQDGSGSNNQTWSGDFTQNTKTPLKEVTEKTGQGVGNDGNTDYYLLVGDSQVQNFSVEEGSANYYTIKGTAKK